MSDLIRREALMKSIREVSTSLLNEWDTMGVLNIVDKQPTVEAVPKSYADQIRWERDIAVEQLNEIGCQFGQKMDEVKKKLGVAHGEWIVGSKPRCSVCGKSALREYDREAWLSYVPSDFCPHCGADMRKKV